MEPALAQFLIEIIMCVFVGGALGNYATSFVHRLPNKEPIFDRDPFCASCDNDLKPRDLFPLVSFLINRAKCRFCSAPIPAVHFIVELLTVGIVVAAYFTFGLSESFILTVMLGISWLVMAMIALKFRYVEALTIYGIFTLILALRILHDGSFYPAFFSGLVLLILGGFAHHKKYITKEELGVWVLTAIALPWPLALSIIVAGYFAQWLICWALKRPLMLMPFVTGIGVYTTLLFSA